MALLKQLGVGVGAGFLMSGVLLLAAESFFPTLTLVPGTLERRIPPALALIGGGLIGGVTAVSTFLLSKDGEGTTLLSEGLKRGMGGEVRGGRMIVDPLTSTSIYIEDEEEEEEETEERNTGLRDMESQLETPVIEWEVPTVETPIPNPPISSPVAQLESLAEKTIQPPKVSSHAQSEKAASGTFSDLW